MKIQKVQEYNQEWENKKPFQIQMLFNKSYGWVASNNKTHIWAKTKKEAYEKILPELCVGEDLTYYNKLP